MEETTTETSTQPAPQKTPTISLPAAIVTGAAILGIAIIFAFGSRGSNPVTTNQAGEKNQQPAPTEVPAEVATVTPSDYITPSAGAEVVIIEYSDSDCEYCLRFHTTMKAALAAYKGKVAWVYRFFPLQRHPNAYTEALSLSCVGELGGQNAFWTYLDTIMNVTLAPDAKSNEALVTYATNAGVNTALFKTCMKTPNTARVDADIAQAQAIGARGTPYSIAVNTKTGEQVIIPGAVSLESLKQTIDSLLK